ncbi:hypothetical protein Ddep01_01652 [Deinococcus depolymerans]
MLTGRTDGNSGEAENGGIGRTPIEWLCKPFNPSGCDS